MCDLCLLEACVLCRCLLLAALSSCLCAADSLYADADATPDADDDAVYIAVYSALYSDVFLMCVSGSR
jgi:hypothetical protein